MRSLNKIIRILTSKLKVSKKNLMNLNRNQQKIFCIGQNKTGTTSLKVALKEFGYEFGNQTTAELLLESWFRRDFKVILEYCKTAEAFQDIPFSLPYTFQQLDMAFKNSKFILTERDSPEQWYKSLTKFHSKLWSNRIELPSEFELKKAEYCYKGFAYDYVKYVFNPPEYDLYNNEVFMTNYINYNNSVKDYFRSRPEKLLVINVSNNDDYGRLCQFLDKKPRAVGFPWKNKT